MEDNKNKLKECLEKRNPILYLGAGFTYESHNKNAEKIELASGLCKKIYEHFWGNGIITTYKNVAADYLKNCNLKEICQLIKQLGFLDERNNFFTNYFSGCQISDDDVRNEICFYPWSKIFSVNVDDLVENIYSNNSKTLNVWNKDNDNKKHSYKFPTLIKLHGCVNNSSNGYVFDNDEYSSFLTNENYLLTEFGDAYSKNDIIFLGTEFQEDDLNHIITKYESMGYEASSVNNYFFITPSINNPLFKMKIESSSYMFHIQMTTKDFFEFLKDEVQLENETYNKLVEEGIKNIYEIYSKIPSEEKYESKLYQGHDIVYGDLKYNWDIFSNDVQFLSWVNSDDHNKLIALYGKDYVGKTCVAKRVLYSFFTQGYDCFEFNLTSSYRIELFLDYINNYCNENVAVLFEGAAFLYELLIQQIINCNPFKKRLVIITTDSTLNHSKKYHSLLKNKYCKSIEVTEKVDYDRANLIYDKLKEKHSLSNLLDISSDKGIIISKMTETNDIIDILYISSLGRGFEDHINNYILSDIKENNYSEKQICLFCILANMGIVNVPKSLFIKCSKMINPAFSEKVFLDKFNKLLQVSKEYYHLRYLRFLSGTYIDKLDNDVKLNIIKAIVMRYSGKFSEGDYNEDSSILYKVLNVRSLRKILPLTLIKSYYQSIEKNCKQYSYYWVQRGICSQKQTSPDYEEADRFLREARIIRPNSYQVTHAIAKNLIERGLESITKKNTESIYYQEGISKLKDLIDDDRYSRAFGYSLHAYIDSLLKYSKAADIIINDDDCKLINEYVRKIDANEEKGVLSNLLIDLKLYANKNHLNRQLCNVTSKHWEKYDITEDDDIAYVESDWTI